MGAAPTTVDFPEPLPAVRDRKAWRAEIDGVTVALSNLDKLFWKPEGYTKADLVGYYHNAARWILPYLRDRPLTLKRMPDGADGEFFYAKQAPEYTPDWIATAPVVSLDTGKTIDYLLAQDRPSLVWLANLGCIEAHPWHARIDEIGRPDYAFFDLDPFDVAFATVREVALLVRTALDRLGLRSYPRTSGATGLQVYVPIDRVHSATATREWVERVCRLINRADPDRTTMAWSIPDRSGKVFLDYGMNTEGRNIAAAYSLRPERDAPVATPLRWEELEGDVEPRDFTIASIWPRLAEVGDLHAPVLRGGQDLRAAMEAVGLDPDRDHPPGHRVRRVDEALARYRERRDFERTPEPPPRPDPPPRPGADPDERQRPAARPDQTDARPRFVIQHHLATRLHHDLRLEYGGTAPSWAVPKGLPALPGLRHLAVRTEDHPLEYLDFSGEIPAGEYGAGPVRIWDRGTYELLEWTDDKVSFRLHGTRHRGDYHLFRTSGSDWMITRTGEPEPLPPPPPAFKPMLAVDGGGKGFDDPGWLFEIKWDGVRAVATTVRPGAGDPATTRLVSRLGNDVSAAYPELAPLWERVLARNAVLDGEVVALDRAGRPSFQRLQRRMHLREEAAIDRARRHTPVSYVVFDLLAVDGEALIDLPLDERVARLGEVFVPGGPFRRSEAVRGEGEALFAAASEQGLEGLIAKRADSRYRPGKRSRDWLKLKVRRHVLCVIGGWLPGEGGRAGHLGSLLVGLYRDGDLVNVGRVGTGFDQAELDHLGNLLADHAIDENPFADGPPLPRTARFVEPTFVCDVEYGEVTDDRVLRAPAYKGIVPDADPRSCLIDEL